MFKFLKQLLVFRLGQKSSKGAARMLGLGKLRMLIGLIGGYRAVKRHRHAHAR